MPTINAGGQLKGWKSSEFQVIQIQLILIDNALIE